LMTYLDIQLEKKLFSGPVFHLAAMRSRRKGALGACILQQ
jgi:hypothetical protein